MKNINSFTQFYSLRVFPHVLSSDFFSELLDKSVGAVEYTDCFSSKGWDFTNECLGYDIKPSDGEAPIMLELWEMQSALSLPLLPGQLLPRVVLIDRFSSMGHIEQCVQTEE